MGPGAAENAAQSSSRLRRWSALAVILLICVDATRFEFCADRVRHAASYAAFRSDEGGYWPLGKSFTMRVNPGIEDDKLLGVALMNDQLRLGFHVRVLLDPQTDPRRFEAIKRRLDRCDVDWRSD